MLFAEGRLRLVPGWRRSSEAAGITAPATDCDPTSSALTTRAAVAAPLSATAAVPPSGGTAALGITSTAPNRDGIAALGVTSTAADCDPTLGDGVAPISPDHVAAFGDGVTSVTSHCVTPDRVAAVVAEVTIPVALAAAIQPPEQAVLIEVGDPVHAAEVDLAVELSGSPPALVADAQAALDPHPIVPALVHPRDLVDLYVDPTFPVAEDVLGAIEAHLDRRTRPLLSSALRRGGTGIPEQQQEKHERRRHAGVTHYADRHADLQPSRPFGVPTS